MDSHKTETGMNTTGFDAVTSATFLSPGPTYVQIAMKAVGTVGNVLSIVANLITIVAIIKERLDKKSPAHILITSLSFADFLCGFSGMMTYIFRLLRPHVSIYVWNTGLWINAGLLYLMFAASLGTTVLIGLDRFVATTLPMKYKFIVTQRVTCVCLLLMWLFMIVISEAPLMYRSTEFDWSKETLFLVNFQLYQPSGYSEKVYGPFLCMMMVIICILYSGMFFSYKKMQRRIHSAISQESQNSGKLTKIFITIVTIMMICWTPVVYFILNPPSLVKMSDYTSLESDLFRVAFLLVTVPSYANNFVYAFQHRDYRTAYLNLLKRQQR